ncbi:TPA: DUF4314 domain-containing protein [Enterococcus faecium]|uniref:DUF4314 domain-containing protein n=2 Tax=Bacillota TaxID=1239 RepID=UPI0022E590F0|nr:DUF4314 domain-containing protein [Longicatena caecimuris]HAQ5929029.1 DUF4314 domain-containing protein [Enterococcus faecium]HBK6675260.1 DUF4314 domain-containing protein [Enterococcus faecium]
MNVAIYLRDNYIEETDKSMILWREKTLLYCMQKKYIPVIIIEVSANGEAAEEYGLNKLEELFRKQYIDGIVTYDISMVTQDIKKMIRFFDTLYKYHIRMDSINQGILEKNFIEKIINFGNPYTYKQQNIEVGKLLKEQFPIGCRVKLERLCSTNESGLTIGDVGTVLGIGNSGIMDIAWDILDGRSLYLHLGVDACQCIMSKEQMEEFLKDICKVPFQNIQRLTDWITLILEPIFPDITLCVNKLKQVVYVELGVSAFQKKKVILEIRYKVGLSSEISIIKTKIRDLEKDKSRLLEKLKRRS